MKASEKLKRRNERLIELWIGDSGLRRCIKNGGFGLDEIEVAIERRAQLVMDIEAAGGMPWELDQKKDNSWGAIRHVSAGEMERVVAAK